NLKDHDPTLYLRDEIRSNFSWGSDKLAICPGQVHEGKGQRWLIEQFLASKELYEHWRLLIVGPMRAEEKEKLAQILQKDTQKRVELLGRREDLPALLAASDLAIFPGKFRESFGMAALEAASMGLPLLLTAAGALAYNFEAYPGMVSVEGRPKIIELWESLDEKGLKALASALPKERIEQLVSTQRWERDLRQILSSKG
ncbi:MAG: glycosyltransferase, partial [Bdellovibrionota bacterium]